MGQSLRTRPRYRAESGNNQLIKYIVPFDNPLEWQERFWFDFSPVCLLTGSAGGGKSRVAAEKMHAFLQRYPGATGLLLRKVRASLPNSALLFMRKAVIGNDPRVVHRPSESRFEYSNGSVLVYGGMLNEEQREHIRSVGAEGGVDIAWMEEATQFSEQDFNEVRARMRGTAGPYRQIILSTNPDAPGHWINVRLILGGGASVHRSNAADNTFNPKDYQETLNKLTGLERRRLVLGEWAVGAGRILDTWEDIYDPSSGRDGGGNVTNDARYVPDGGEVIWAVDDGYVGQMDDETGIFTGRSHPRTILFCQLRKDGRIAIFHENLQIYRGASDHINDAIKVTEENGWPLPDYVVHDRSAASLSGALQEAGFATTYEAPLVDESVKELREWLARDSNGVRRLIVAPDCFYTRYQFATYSYNDRGGIIKEHDDTCDAARYLVWNMTYGTGNIGVDIATYATIMGNRNGRQQN